MTINLFPTTLSPPTGKAIAFISNTSGKIAIRFLSSSNQGNNAIQISIQRFIIFHSQRIRGSFYNLIRIGIIKRKVTAMFSLHQTTGYGKVIEAPVLLTFFKCGRYGDCTIGFNTRSPEVIVQVNLCKRNFFNRSIRLNVGFAASTHAQKGDATEKELDSFLHNIIYVFLVRYQKCTAKEKDLS